MAYNTMYFSRSSSGYNAENGDYIDFNPDSSISFGALYKCTTFYCSITGGITSATTSARDHDMNLQIQINGSWITIWSGTQYLPKRGTTGYTITFSGSIPSGSQVNAAKYGISDIRLQQDGDYALRGANASGYIDVNYEDNVTSCGAPTSVKINNSTSTVSTTGSSVTLSWSGASGGTNNSISSYRIFYTNSTDGSTWDGWYEYTDYASTSTSGSLTVNLGNAGTYRKFGIATVGSAGDEYGSARVESPIVYRQAISACGAPTSCSLSSTLATGNVTLSWSGASAGTSNSIKGYKIQRCESSNGSSWGSWADLTTVSSTSTSASLTVSPPSTAGNYYKYRVLTMGSAGSSYYSGYKESTNTLRRNWTSCGAPTSVSVSSTNVAPNTSVTLSWSGATSGYGNAISGYQIYRSTRSSGTYTKIADVTSTSASGSYSVSAPGDRNASYYYKVLTVGSVSGFNSGQSSATATLTCSWGDVSAPTGVTLSATYTTSGSNVTLSWNAASNATNNAVTGYHIYRDGAYYGATTSTSMSVPAHSTAGSSYTYTVYTLGTYSNSGASSGVTVYTYGNPSAPTTVTVSNASPEAGSTVSLTWRDAAAGGYNAITGYKIYRATSADGTYSYLATVSSSSTSGSCNVDAPGSMGGTYYFKVVTVGARSESGMSAYVSVTAKTYTKCSTPSSLALETTVSSGSNATLSWEASTSGTNNTVNGYQIQRRESSDGTTYDDWASLATIGSASTTSLSVSPPSVAGHYYQYRIRATGSAGESFYSDWKVSSNRLYRDYTKCTAPTSFSLSIALSREDVTLSWSGAGDGFYNTVVDYEIQRCENSNGSTWGEWGVPTTTSGTSITVSPPSTAGNSYKYRIRVRGSAGSSYYSDWVESSNTLTKDYTRCIQPSFCTLSANTSKVDVTLSWGTSGNGDGNTFVGYEVQRSGSADRSTWNDWETIVSKTTSTQISVSPPTASGCAYKFRVRGLGSVGNNYHSLFTESDGFLMLGTVDIGSFTDTVLTPGVTLVKAVHITELQNAVNIIATIYGSQQFSFSEVVPYSESGCSYIKDWTSHITEIRNAIDSISSSHEDWIAIPENKPLASAIQQIRSILKSMQ